MKEFFFEFFFKWLFKKNLALLSALIERFSVSSMQDLSMQKNIFMIFKLSQITLKSFVICHTYSDQNYTYGCPKNQNFMFLALLVVKLTKQCFMNIKNINLPCEE